MQPKQMCSVTVATLSGLNVDYVGLCQFPEVLITSFSLLPTLSPSQGS
jgi:hypothetical protein